MISQNRMKETGNLILDPRLWAGALRREKWRICIILLFSSAASLMLGRCIPGRWQSSALIIMSPAAADEDSGWNSVPDETMAGNVRELITRDEVLLKAMERSGIDDLAEFRAMIGTEHPEGTNLIRITAGSRNPETAEKAVQAVADISARVLGEEMNLRSLQVISGASEAERKEYMNTVRTLLYGLSVWLVLSGFYLMFLMYQYPLRIPEAGQFCGIRICRTMQDILFCCGTYREVYVIRTAENGRMPAQAYGISFASGEETEGLYEQCRQARRYGAALLQISETASRPQILSLLGNAEEYGINVTGMVTGL